ncbi:MAG: hypothetical protein AUK34_10860 [Ignavibacteria bacterium CG2_30_36_16]|nr:hypothetical protein [Ignavibacteria bacterium]OIP56729.1 MAG: hypothetical protein AUK34_10860 [Ignavibacteria bacterium CG2_30_36_16]
MKKAKNNVTTQNPVFGMYILFYLTIPFNLFGQSYVGLNQLENFQTKTYYSNGSIEQAKEMAERCDNVVSFYAKLIDFEPSVTLLVLSKEDWSKHTKFPVYGMPHYNDNNTLIVASQDNDFWKSFIPPIENMPQEIAHQISKTYADENGTLTMRGFFDLLAIHELGHAFHIQGGLTMQRKWMGELFANIFLHTYIAEKEPELLPALTIFPKMVVSSTNKNDLQFTSLSELETNYEKIGQEYPNNYGWYQCRWHIAAGNIYNQGKVEVFKNLWQTLMTQKEILDDISFSSLLYKQVHQSVADVQLKWED